MTPEEIEARIRLGELDLYACVRWKLPMLPPHGFADPKYHWSSTHLVGPKKRLILQPAHGLCGVKVSGSAHVLPARPNLHSFCSTSLALAHALG